MALIKVEYEVENDWWLSASVPSMPGCCTQARNMIELRESVMDAMCLWITSYYDSRVYGMAFETAHRDMKEIEFVKKV